MSRLSGEDGRMTATRKSQAMKSVVAKPCQQTYCPEAQFFLSTSVSSLHLSLRTIISSPVKSPYLCLALTHTSYTHAYTSVSNNCFKNKLYDRLGCRRTQQYREQICQEGYRVNRCSFSILSNQEYPRPQFTTGRSIFTSIRAHPPYNFALSNVAEGATGSQLLS